MDFVRYEHHDQHIAIVTLDRPDRLNALGAQMRAEFDEALIRAERDEAIASAREQAEREIGLLLNALGLIRSAAFQIDSNDTRLQAELSLGLARPSE